MVQPAVRVALVGAVFLLFSVFDWNRGLIRAGLLSALAIGTNPAVTCA